MWRSVILLVLLAVVALAAVDYPTGSRGSHRKNHEDQRPGGRGRHREGRREHPGRMGNHHGERHHRGRGRGRNHHVHKQAAAAGVAQQAASANDQQARTGAVFSSMLSGSEPSGLNWKINYLFGGGKPWWKGINVCENVHETVENITSSQNGADGAPITHHQFFTRASCDETPSAYTCTTVTNIFGMRKTSTVTNQCCHGYEREKGKSGCPIKLTLRSMVETMSDAGAGEMVRGMRSMGLTDLLDEGNYTVFAPKDMAFKSLMVQPDRSEQENVVVITPEVKGIVGNVQQVLMAHMVPGVMRTGVFSDELLLPTSNPNAKIRINIYDTPKQMITANCVPIEAPDKMAENGVVHITEGLLSTAENTVADIVSKDPELSTFKTLLGRLGIVQALRNDGQFTLFAPTNAAFRKIKPSLLNKLLYGDACLGTLVRTHLLPNVICSSIILGKVKTRNVLGHYVNLTRDADNKVWLGHAQVISRDIMASNGVVHLVDNVLVPDDVLDILQVAEKVGATEFIKLVKEAGLQKQLETTDNVTLFLPSNLAITNMPAEDLAALKANKADLAALVKYHVTPGLVRSVSIGHNQRLSTLNGKTISVKEFFSAPFGIRRETTAQCARLSHRDLETCNGVVHIVDQVLTPPRGDVLDTLSQMSNMSILVGLLKESGLAESLQSHGPYTFIAPSNKAWNAVDEQTLNTIRSDPQRLQGLLKHHITSGTICCAGMFHQRMLFVQRERMLDSSMLRMDSDAEGTVSIGGHTPIAKCDVTATNGVVHVVDQVLPVALRKYSRVTEIGRGHSGAPHNPNQGGGKTKFKNLAPRWDISFPDMDPFYHRVNMHWDAFMRQLERMRQGINRGNLRFGKKK